MCAPQRPQDLNFKLLKLAAADPAMECADFFQEVLKTFVRVQAAKRLAGARLPDKFESQPVEFFRRVADGYENRLQADPARFARIDARRSREAVWSDVKQVFVAKGWLP